MGDKLTHINEDGEVHMVDVGDKNVTQRQAVATSKISMSQAAFDAVKNGNLKKGDALGVARVAGIMAAKNTSQMIPLCHPLMLTKIEISIEPDDTTSSFDIKALVRVEGKTGVEMEALTAASVTALTIYDMAKAVDKSMVIGPTQLEQKSGGKSGDYNRE
ncbi:cyclic pyranopterin monophosphate synthase MoaC [Maritalea porphyrae]|uniref:Cyclic pyranopterin monophosphate synthase n=1 Tax=Maritalea porphyrae TaxID=880732 RepID=A0ABQ5UWU8_9HYPH|nr:cyclic pyranopterin monophosphate synthase MoaC [Maritalea porphyrae]GLQ18472.1 cyclic pyranopterin monophosphate synthase accessory protein [Maritalea porphyrae]